MHDDPALTAIICRLNDDNAMAKQRAAKAQQAAYAVAKELARTMGDHDRSLRKVILFGSALPGRNYRLDSDIDLAIDGGNRALLERLTEPISQKVDIITIDDLRPGIRESVLAEGEELYDANAQ